MDIEHVNPNEGPPYFHFNTFSASWIAIFEFFKLTALSMKKDLSVFMKMGFLGAVCVSTMIVFVIIYGFLGISNTEYHFKTGPAESESHGMLW